MLGGRDHINTTALLCTPSDSHPSPIVPSPSSAIMSASASSVVAMAGLPTPPPPPPQPHPPPPPAVAAPLLRVPIPNTTQPHLLAIPGEIRNLIYKQLLIFSDPIPIFREPSLPSSSSPHKAKKARRRPNPVSSVLLPVLLTSRLLHAEAAGIFYSYNTFSLPRSAAHRAPLQVQHNLLTRRFLDVIGPRNAALLRRLVLPFPADPGLLLAAHWRESAFAATSALTRSNSARLRTSRRREGGGGEANPFDLDPGAALALVKAVAARCPRLEAVALDMSGDNHWLRILRPHACAVRAMLGPVDKALREAFPRLGEVELWVGEGPASRGQGADGENGRERWSWTSVVEMMPPEVGGVGIGIGIGIGGGGSGSGGGGGVAAAAPGRGFGTWTTGNGVGVAVRAAMTRREWRWVKQVVEEEDEDGEWKGWRCTVARPEVGWIEEQEELQEDDDDDDDDDDEGGEEQEEEVDNGEQEAEASYHPDAASIPRYVHHGRDPAYLLYGPPELALRSEMHDCWTRRTMWVRFAAAFVRSPTAARRELREAREWLAWKKWMIDQAGPPPVFTTSASGSGTPAFCDSGSGRSFRDVYPARPKKPLARRVKKKVMIAASTVMRPAFLWYLERKYED
ncbi:hypothetical protein VTJ83DRAFT_1406 [Remersonia thermophila]|uniref:Uncharacterized protein n=1 Tax=Remersonia thermophila TaxID=72144 RepID=A0ABR4DP50_9PEZI